MNQPQSQPLHLGGDTFPCPPLLPHHPTLWGVNISCSSPESTKMYLLQGRWEGRRKPKLKAKLQEQCTAAHLSSLYSKCFNGVVLVNLVEICLCFIEMLKISPKCRQVLKTSVQYESCLTDLTLNPTHLCF